MNKKQIIDLVSLYVKKVKRGGIPVSAAYVFGSRIKGKATKESDIDACIISPKFGKNRFDERLKLMNFVEGAYDLIEPHPYSPADFQNVFDSLANEIRQTGIKLSI